MEDKKIAFFQEKLNEIQTGNPDLMTWYDILSSSLPQGSEIQSKIKQFSGALKILDNSPIAGNAEITKFFGSKEANRARAIELLEGYIKQLKAFDNSLSPSVVLNVNQSVSINVLIEAVKDELTGKQYQQLLDIVKSQDSSGNKKAKILNTVKSFGENVASNILATIVLKAFNIQ